MVKVLKTVFWACSTPVMVLGSDYFMDQNLKEFTPTRHAK